MEKSADGNLVQENDILRKSPAVRRAGWKSLLNLKPLTKNLAGEIDSFPHTVRKTFQNRRTHPKDRTRC